MGFNSRGWGWAALGWVIAAAVYCCGSPGNAQETVTVIPVQEDIGDWVLDEASGRIFASSVSKDAVVEFDAATGKEVRRITVGGKPRQLVIKGRRLVASLETGPALAVIDLESNKVEGTVALEGGAPVGLSCSAADNPYVYVRCPGSGDADNDLFQVDVAARAVRKRASTRSWELGGAQHIAFSPDGRYAVADNRTPSSHGEAMLLQVDEKQCALAKLGQYRYMVEEVTAAPSGLFWAMGNRLAPIDFVPRSDEMLLEGRMEPGDVLRKFVASPVAIHPTLDLVAVFKCSRSYSVVFQTLSKAAELKTVDFARPKGGFPRQKTYWDNAVAQFDAQRGRVLAAWGRIARVVNMAPLGLPENPFVYLVVPSRISARMDEPVKVPLRVSNSSLKPTFELADAPSGMAIDKTATLTWAPTAKDVGTHWVKVRAVVGKSADEREVEVRVNRPGLVLDFVARKVAVDAAGKRALIAGFPAQARPERSPFPGRERTASRLALVDLVEKKVLAERSLDKGAAALALDEKAAYLAPEEGNALHALKLADLSNDKRVFLDGPPVALALLPGDRVLAEVRNQDEFHSMRVRLRCFRRDTLAKVPFAQMGESAPMEPGMLPTPFPADERRPPASPLNDGTLVGGVVFGPERGAVQLLVWREPALVGRTPDLLDLSYARPDPRDRELREPPSTVPDRRPWKPRLWNRTVTSQGLFDRRRSAIVTWGPGPSILLRDYPLAATVTLEPEKERRPAPPFGDHGMSARRPTGPKLVLVLREVVEGTPKQSLVLSDQPIPRGLDGMFQMSSRLAQVADARDKVVAAFGRNVFIVPIAADSLGTLHEPVRFLNKQTVLEAKVGDPVEIALQAVGGTGKKTYKLLSPPEGITLDPSSGKLKLDTEFYWKRLGTLVSRLSRSYSLSLRGERDSIGYLQKEIVDARAEYGRLFGKATEDVPMYVGFDVAAVDEQSQSARLAAKVVLLGPRGKFDQMVADAQQAAAKEREEEAAKRKLAAERIRKERASREGKPSQTDPALLEQFAKALQSRDALNAQIARLERRMGDLEGRLTEIKSLLPDAKGAAGGSGQPPAAQVAGLNESVEPVGGRFDQLQEHVASLETASQQQQGYLKMLMIALVVLLAGLIGLGVLMMAILRGRKGPVQRTGG